MNPCDQLTERQLDLLCHAIRILGMRGELQRHHEPFVPIVERHACAVDAAEYRRLMDTPTSDPMAEAAALAALAGRSAGLKEEFGKEEARRFRLYDQPHFDEFAGQLEEVLARIGASRVVALQMEDRAQLEKLKRRIPDGEEPSGPRWRKEGLDLHARALVKAREIMEETAAAAERERMAGLGRHAAAQRKLIEKVREDLAVLPDIGASTTRIEACVDRRRRASAASGRRGGAPRKDEDLYDHELVMKAIDRRVRKDMKQMAAVHEVREEYRLKDNPISTTAETLAKQYRAWRAVRAKRTDKG